VFAQKSDPDVLFIVVSHLGDVEAKPNLNIRRLHNVRTYLTEFILRKYRRKPETIILAQGERVKGLGRIDFYVKGQLYETLEIRRNDDLIVGTCYPDPVERNPCTLDTDRNFYPLSR
jgi:hypothetical protein